MPELPEVETLVRHLAPLLRGQKITGVTVRRAKVIRPTSEAALRKALVGATFTGLTRRGKYLVFALRGKKPAGDFTLLGHLGMSGRIYLIPRGTELAKHAAVVLDFAGKHQFVYEDARYFGRFTLDTSPIEKLGPEPTDPAFSTAYFGEGLKRSSQPIKVKLLDQTLVAGVGNIYASEALFMAGITPKKPGNKLTPAQLKKLRQSILAVLKIAIKFGSTVPLDFHGGKKDGLFYYGTIDEGAKFYQERLQVYDRAGKPCRKCGTPIQRIIQAARSTFFCPRCQQE